MKSPLPFSNFIVFVAVLMSFESSKYMYGSVFMTLTNFWKKLMPFSFVFSVNAG